MSDLYFAGSLMHARDFKETQSGFVHGFRYNIRLLSRLLMAEYENTPLTNREVDLRPKAMAQAILDRVNSTSGLWQQNGFLCDVLAVNSGALPARYFEELSSEYVRDVWSRDENDYFVLTLNFGLEKIKNVANVFAIPRPNKDDVSRAQESAALHPIIEHYRDGELVSVHHVIEDLRAEWKEPKHFDPLVAYFEKELNAPPALKMHSMKSRKPGAAAMAK